MTKNIKYLSGLTLTLLVVACASKRVEQFDENFYSYKDSEQRDAFSFVVSMSNMSGDGINIREIYTNTRNNDGSRSTSRRRIVESTGPRPENPDDINVPIKFRMEEIAFERLNVKLANINYCSNGYEVTESDYEKFRYKIKGFCKPAELTN